jgi:hypothetical protein
VSAAVAAIGRGKPHRQVTLMLARGFVVLAAVALIAAQPSTDHPRLLFTGADLAAVKARSSDPALQATAQRVLARAQWQLTAPPLIPSLTARGAPDPPGEQKGLACARALQGRVLTYAMAFTLTGERRYRDAAVGTAPRD